MHFEYGVHISSLIGYQQSLKSPLKFSHTPEIILMECYAIKNKSNTARCLRFIEGTLLRSRTAHTGTLCLLMKLSAPHFNCYLGYDFRSWQVLIGGPVHLLYQLPASSAAINLHLVLAAKILGPVPDCSRGYKSDKLQLHAVASLALFLPSASS
jgi:hypothetical protein